MITISSGVAGYPSSAQGMNGGGMGARGGSSVPEWMNRADRLTDSLYGDGSVAGKFSPSSAVENNPDPIPQPVQDAASGETVSDSYVDGKSSAQQARDNNLGILDQLLGSLTGENQKILQDLQASAARAQYEYSERLSSTAYQRAVRDMKEAGLNPAVMFAGSSGSSASTPQVGIASVASENQLLTFISSASSIISSLGSLLKGIGLLFA